MSAWTGLRSRRFLSIASIAAAVVVLGGVATGVTLTGKPSNHNSSGLSGAPAQPASAKSPFRAVANVTPPVAVSACRTPTPFTYRGTLSASAAGTVTYQWVYSAGKPGPVHTVRFTKAGHTVVNGATVKPRKAGGGWGEIKVISPAVQTSNKAMYKLLCGGGSAGGITVTAAVEPAARTVSCATAPLAFTATGSITASRAETVRYHWAQPDGASSAPATLVFTKPGTQPVVPLTIRPPAASGSGAAVLVVTSPVTAASSPATYTLTCTASTTSPIAPALAGNPPPPTSTGSGPTGGPPPLPPNLSVTANIPATAYVGLPYSGTVTVTGGVGPYNWSAVSGLPDGLTATANGATLTISGTPAFWGTSGGGGSVTDSYSLPQTGYWEFKIAVVYAPVIISCPTEQATDGQPYLGTLTATGGNGTALTWSVPALPPDLTGTADGGTYTISGTPDVVFSGTSYDYELDVIVSDSQTSFGESCNIVINP